MISDLLLGAFETQLTDASDRELRYRLRADGTKRCFGGYNLLTLLGDFGQLTPLSPGGPIFVPPTDTLDSGAKQQRARTIKDMFWTADDDSLNFFAELVETKRFDDKWYEAVLNECRAGALSEENYSFLHGLPTGNPGTWRPGCAAPLCGNPRCATLAEEWRRQPFAKWPLQYKSCRNVYNAARNVNAGTACWRLKIPKCSSTSSWMLRTCTRIMSPSTTLCYSEPTRARSGTRNIACGSERRINSLIVTKSPKIQRSWRPRKSGFCNFTIKKQQGCWTMSVVRRPEDEGDGKNRHSKAITIMKHTSCTVVGWRLHPLDRLQEGQCSNPEGRFLDYLPEMIFVKFGRRHLEVGRFWYWCHSNWTRALKKHWKA